MEEGKRVVVNTSQGIHTYLSLDFVCRVRRKKLSLELEGAKKKHLLGGDTHILPVPLTRDQKHCL